jgi:hypothetical protein
MLFDNAEAEVSILWDIDLPPEHQEVIYLQPFCTSNGAPHAVPSQLSRSLRDRLFLWIVTKATLNFSEDVVLFSDDVDSGQGMDVGPRRISNSRL